MEVSSSSHKTEILSLIWSSCVSYSLLRITTLEICEILTLLKVHQTIDPTQWFVYLSLSFCSWHAWAPLCSERFGSLDSSDCSLVEWSSYSCSCLIDFCFSVFFESCSDGCVLILRMHFHFSLCHRIWVGDLRLIGCLKPLMEIEVLHLT